MTRPTSRVSRVIVSGPLAQYAEVYRAELRRRGYTVRSCVNELRQVAHLSLWLEDRGLGAAELNLDLIEEFVVWRRDTGRNLSHLSRPGLACMLEVLVGAAVVTVGPAPAPSSDTELVLERFERYLSAERALAAGTIVGYLDRARRFLDELPAGGLAELSSAQVSAAVLERSQSVAVSTTQNYVAALRSLLRFL